METSTFKAVRSVCACSSRLLLVFKSTDSRTTKWSDDWPTSPVITTALVLTVQAQAPVSPHLLAQPMPTFKNTTRPDKNLDSLSKVCYFT